MLLFTIQYDMKGHFYITPTSSSPVFVTEHGCWLSQTCFPNLKMVYFYLKVITRLL